MGGDARPPKVVSEEAWQLMIIRLRLSPREAQIVGRIFCGDATEKDIALSMGVPQKTVHSHLVRMHDKLGVRTRAQLLLRVFSELVDQEW